MSPSLLHDLHHQLLKSRIPTSSHRYIVTDEALRSIFTKENVHSLLLDELHVTPGLVPNYAAAIMSHAIKILAILTCIGRTSSLINCLVNLKIRDSGLPFAERDLPAGFAAEFLTEQYHFLAPAFSRGFFQDWRADIILPFISNEPIDNAEGSFATVYKIEIIPQFQKLLSQDQLAPSKVYFARKELRTRRSEGLEAFQREKQVLGTLNLIRHQHIIPLLASYIHDDRFNMIFPLADANLEDIFGSRTKVSTRDESLWRQMVGLTSALTALHNFRYVGSEGPELERIGYHHDLKPQNILLKDGVLLLADFGLARLKDVLADSGTDNKHGTATYGAPESQSRDDRIAHSRPMDIWSWGCIIIEIITFILLGSPGIQDFRRCRLTRTGLRLDSYFHNMAGLKVEVREWMEHLRRSAVDQNYRFKNMVTDTMITVEQMLSSDPITRPSALAVEQAFRKSLEVAVIGDTMEAAHSGFTTALQNGHSLVAVASEAGASSTGSLAENALENLATFLDEDHPVMLAIKSIGGPGSMP